MKKTHLYKFTEEKCNNINNLIQEVKDIRGLHNKKWKRNIWNIYFMDISEIDFELLHQFNYNQLKLIIALIRRILSATGCKLIAFEIDIKTLPTTRILLDNSIRCFIAKNYGNSVMYLLALLLKLKLDAYECMHESLKSAISKKGYINNRGFFIRNKGAYNIDQIHAEYDSIFDNIIEKENSFEIYFKNELIEVIDKWYTPIDFNQLKL